MSFSGFQPPDSTQPAIERGNVMLNNDGFFPVINVSHFIRTERISDEYRGEVITRALQVTMLNVNHTLQSLACTWVRQGYFALNDVPAIQYPTIDNGEETAQSFFCLMYEEAVYSLSKCRLMHDYATMNRKEQAENVGKEALKRCPDLQNRYNFAIDQLFSSGAMRGSNEQVSILQNTPQSQSRNGSFSASVV